MKIVIYPDSVQCLLERYTRLTDEQEVHVRGLGVPGDYASCRQHWERLEAAGFRRELFQEGIGDPSSERADRYYVDGLQGRCFAILDQLPKEKCILVTDDFHIADRGRERGYTSVLWTTL
ncbi:MAG TPA: hypothetical protein VJB16_00180 [archaeon]|nr:hypothetical protein [archaeon]